MKRIMVSGSWPMVTRRWHLEEVRPGHGDRRPELAGGHVENAGREIGTSFVGHAEALVARVVGEVEDVGGRHEPGDGL